MNVGRMIAGVTWLLVSMFSLAWLLQAAATSNGLARGLVPLILFAGCGSVFLGMYAIGIIFSRAASWMRSARLIRNAAVHSAVQHHLHSQLGRSEMIFLYQADAAFVKQRATIDVDPLEYCGDGIMGEIVRSMVVEYRAIEATPTTKYNHSVAKPLVASSATLKLLNLSEREWGLQSCR